MNATPAKISLRELACSRYAAWTRGEVPYVAPHDGPAEAQSSITDGIWYIGAKHVQRELVARGFSGEEITAAMAELKRELGVIEAEDIAVLPRALADAIAADLAEALTEEAEDTARRLDEKHVKSVTELRIEIRLDESKHRGRPHVVVVLQDGEVSVSLDSPPELLTPHDYREASALKVVAKHRKALLAEWDATRPDDQKLTPRE